jgi:hypothetical protein
MGHKTRKDRIYNNTEIQELIVDKAKNFAEEELAKYCREEYCKTKLDLNYALFIKMPISSSEEELDASIKDHNEQSRWTWRYKFTVGNFAYAITTQWYDRNDEYVKKWLLNN